MDVFQQEGFKHAARIGTLSAGASRIVVV